ncbi:terpene synthase-like isoform X2 [Tenebrio molitor]|uniref:terpene synthase-like isoform X2 n=1 Tax=Tenebrio molitor TaxID=7067 RepID=UPI0036247C12
MVDQTVHASSHSETKHNLDEDEIVLLPFSYIKQEKFENKSILAKIWCAFDHWFNVPKNKFIKITGVSEKIYTVGLLTDDVTDDSELRGGIPTAHLIYGVARTCNVTNYVLLTEMDKLLDLQEPKVIDYFIEMGLELVRSQGLDIYYRNKCICPTESEYVEFARGKFTPLVTFVVRLLQLFSNNKTTDFSVLIEKLSLFCQIYNDYLSLHSKKYSTLKTFCDDVSEGKFSFPIIHAIRSQPNDVRILNILKQKTRDIEIKKHFVCLLEKFGSFEYTRKKLEKLRDEAIEEMNRIGKNPRMEEIFKIMLNNLENEVNCD